MCQNGIRGGKSACCPKSCGTCGGANCDKRPGGTNCCVNTITNSSRACTSMMDTACIIPQGMLPRLSLRDVSNGGQSVAVSVTDAPSRHYLPGRHLATVRGRYVRIHSLKAGFRDTHPVLNLAEVQAFSPLGKLLKPVGAELSTTYSDAVAGWETQASKCIDGKLSTMCASLDNSLDKDPILVIDYGATVTIASIQVSNRLTCCSERIDGAAVSITNDGDGHSVVWKGTFNGTQDAYTFNPPSVGRESWFPDAMLLAVRVLPGMRTNTAH